MKLILTIQFGAGEGNRTPLNSLEGCGNSHYTTPAKGWLILVGWRAFFKSILLFPKTLLQLGP